MRKILCFVALATLGAGCDDHDHEDEASLGEEACESFHGSDSETVTAGDDAATAPDSGREGVRYELTLPELPGGGHGGHLKFAIDDAVDHVLYFSQDVNLVVSDASGTALATTKATSDADCDDAKAVYTVPFTVGEFDLLISATDSVNAEVQFVLLSTEEHEH